MSIVKGRRVGCWISMQPGDYCFYTNKWYGRPPGSPVVINFDNSLFKVTEHDDNTITVTPHIVACHSEGQWIGYLTRGMWIPIGKPVDRSVNQSIDRPVNQFVLNDVMKVLNKLGIGFSIQNVQETIYLKNEWIRPADRIPGETGWRRSDPVQSKTRLIIDSGIGHIGLAMIFYFDYSGRFLRHGVYDVGD